MASLLVAASAAEGIGVCHTGVQISAIEQNGDEFKVMAGDSAVYAADVVVNAACRLPDISELGLDRVDIAHSRKGIVVNTNMQTTQPHIYAVGDCAATVQLARVADYEAMVAANTISGAGEGNAWPEMNYAGEKFGVNATLNRGVDLELYQYLISSQEPWKKRWIISRPYRHTCRSPLVFGNPSHQFAKFRIMLSLGT